MKVFIGANHEGYEYKTSLAQALQMAGHEVTDVGNHSIDPNDDFTSFAKELVVQMQSSPEAKGILISGTGQGMAMAANRFKGIRASVCWNRSTAESARSQHDSNVLCLSTRYLSLEEAGSIMATWLAGSFSEDEAEKSHLQQLDEIG